MHSESSRCKEWKFKQLISKYLESIEVFKETFPPLSRGGKWKACGIWHLLHRNSPATSSSNVIFDIPRHSVTSPQDQANTGPTVQPWKKHLKNTGLHPGITDLTGLQVQTLDGCVRVEDRRHCLPKKKSSNQSENVLASLVTSRNNIHPLSVKKCETVNVWQVQATSGQIISNMFSGLSPFIAASVPRQTDVNDRVI